MTSLSQVTGISIGWPPDMPRFRARALRGTMTAAQAFERLLAGSGWVARRLNATAYRIERQPPPVHTVSRPGTSPPVAIPPPAAPPPVVEIIVTGQKRRQRLGDVATSVAVVPLASKPAQGLAMGSRELAFSIDGLALTNLGPGRNRQFIRGVADSAFNGPSQSTVAIQLDEARVTFDAPDPDLRLVDMDRVEVLKGPQGPLYGSGTLGGIYHLVTRKPDLVSIGGSAGAIAEAVQHGGPGVGGELVLNLPLKTDELALRGVAYTMHAGGWIDNVGRNRDANRTVTDGARLALRWRPAADWTFDVAGVLQDINAKDSQYVTANDTTRRGTRIPEPTDNDFKSIAATLQGRLDGLKLLATSSYVDHDIHYTLDSTDSSGLFGLSGPSRFDSDSRYTITSHELRLSPASSSNWIVGLSYLRAHSRTEATVATAEQSLNVEALDHFVTELAVFGEVSVAVAPRWTLTAGARLFRSITEDEASERSGGASHRMSKTLVAPSMSLAWTPDGSTLIYLRYARAVRPGGLAPAETSGTDHFHSDDLGTLDLGMRYAPARGRLSATGSLFYTDWNHIQSDYLLSNGLVSTRNAGHGRIIGLEASLEWQMARGLRLTAGGSMIDASLIDTENGLKLSHRRLPVVPDASARLAVSYGFDLGRWRTDLSAQANYVGLAHLSFDPDLDRTMGNYAPVMASASFARGRWVLSARIDNMFDMKGDTFAFGNQFSILHSQQYTPLRPRTFTLSVSRSW